MACCINIETVDLGCFTCKDEIILPVATINGEHEFTLKFRGASRTKKQTFAIGDEIDLAQIFEFGAAPYQYEVIVTDTNGDSVKYCITLELLIKC